MYRTIDVEFWDDMKVWPLEPIPKLLLNYLFTNRHSHFSGLYRITPVLMAEGLNIPVKGIEKSLPVLMPRFILCDDTARVIWVKKMFKRQCPKPTARHLQGVANQLSSLAPNNLIALFLQEYDHLGIPFQSHCNPIPIPCQYPEQKMDQKMEQEQVPPLPPKGKRKPVASHDPEFIKEQLSGICIADYEREYAPQGLDVFACWEDFYDCTLNGTDKDPRPNPFNRVDFEKAFRNRCKWCLGRGWFLLRKPHPELPTKELSLAERMARRGQG